MDLSKLPKSLTTVTPLSKTLALIIFTTFPFLGFFLGYRIRLPVQEKIVYVKVPSPTATPYPNHPNMDCPNELCIENGVVYYTDVNNQKIKIVESFDDGTPNRHYYEYANLSPQKNFIHLSGSGWEWIFDEIYDIKTRKIYPSDSSGQIVWLNDERLLVIGGCGMGYMECGKIMISINNKTPWKQKLFAETPYK